MATSSRETVRFVLSLISGSKILTNRLQNLDLLTGNDKIIRSYTTPSRPQSKNTTGDIMTGNDKIIRSYTTQTRPIAKNTSGSDILTANDKIIRSYTTQSRPQAKNASGSDILTGNDKIIRSYNTTSQQSRVRRASSTSAHHRPLMQGFSTSAVVKSSNVHAPANVQVSSIDNFIFPAPPSEPPRNPFEKLRVPLLPDNYAPNRSAGSPHALETPDILFIKEEEPRIVAAFPEDVSAMSEVVGDESRDMSLSDLTKMVKDKFVEVQEPGVLKSLFNDILDDVLGPKQGKAKLAH